MYDRLLFILEETWANLRRNGLMQLAAISTATVALILLGSVGMILYKLDLVAQSLPQQFEVEVYMRPHLPRERTLELKKRLEAMPEVQQVVLKSREEAWREEQQRLAGEVNLSDLPNPLPDKLIVRAKQPALGMQIAKWLRQEPAVDEVIDRRSDLAMVLGVARFVRWGGLSLSSVLLLATLVLIYNTIRLTVLARQTEVRIMALVGASHRTIRLPFILEGAVQGGLGGLLASALVLAGARVVSNYVAQNWGFLGGLPGGAPPGWVVLGLVSTGTLIGAFCATWAAQRFVRIH